MHQAVNLSKGPACFMPKIWQLLGVTFSDHNTLKADTGEGWSPHSSAPPPGAVEPQGAPDPGSPRRTGGRKCLVVPGEGRRLTMN